MHRARLVAGFYQPNTVTGSSEVETCRRDRGSWWYRGGPLVFSCLIGFVQVIVAVLP